MSRTAQVKKLYKTILRLHRALPKELRILGNDYVRDEFKRHKACKEIEANIFCQEWIEYALTLKQQVVFTNMDPRKKNLFGKNIDPSLLEEMRDEQIAQFYELMKAAKHQTDDDIK